MTDKTTIATIALCLTVLFSGYVAVQTYVNKPIYQEVTYATQTTSMRGHIGVVGYMCEDGVWVSEIDSETLFVALNPYSDPKTCVVTVKRLKQ